VICFSVAGGEAKGGAPAPTHAPPLALRLDPEIRLNLMSSERNREGGDQTDGFKNENKTRLKVRNDEISKRPSCC